MKALTAAVCFSAVLIGCSPKMSPDFGWDKIKWVVTELNEAPVQRTPGLKDAFLEFAVPDSKFSGNGGCNSLGGEYSVDKNHIHFTKIISTKMSCPDINFESTFIALLEKADKYEVRNNTMLLKQDDKVLIMLKAR